MLNAISWAIGFFSLTIITGWIICTALKFVYDVMALIGSALWSLASFAGLVPKQPPWLKPAGYTALPPR